MNNDSAPLISIIVAVFNGMKTLQKCIDSVSMQTYPNRELLILDGGSQDGTVELLIKNERKINYWISEPDNGICHAWNKGLDKSKGEWICFIGADDYFWDSQVLERLADHLVKLTPDIHVAYGQIMMVNDHDESLCLKGEPWDRTKKYFTQFMNIAHQGVMHRRSLFDQYGGFDYTFRIAGDYELLLRDLKTNEAFFIPDIIIAGMCQGGISSQHSNSVKTMLEFRRAQRKHGQPFPGLHWCTAMSRVCISWFIWNLFEEKTARKFLDIGRRLRGLSPYWTRT
ncbi:MAG: glycosyltransferase family 2 protein [Smithella sp.]|jgi:glycosyltransferase involved in cell wall biosynthesis